MGGGLSEEVEEGLVEEGGLDPAYAAGLTLLTEVHAAERRGLHVSANLNKKNVIFYVERWKRENKNLLSTPILKKLNP